MTPRTRSRIRQGWDWGKGIALVSSIVLLMQQYVALRGTVARQAQEQTSTAASMASVIKDVGRLARDVDKIEGRVSRLERTPRSTFVTQRAAAAADTVARSPGLVRAAGTLLMAPLRFLGAVFQGG